jgi:3-isopropylmalate/(R)-2-methylmalate dehydratase small subunit
LVKPGDILLGGKNFGMGSSRPAARNLRNLGLACLIAHSINGLFYRNAVNFAFPAMECDGIEGLFEEGQTAEADFARGIITNLDTGRSLPARTIPPELLKIVDAGGIFPLLEREGYIAPRA